MPPRRFSRSQSLPPSGRDLLVSETFVSVQGEGISTGAPAAFLRLGNCNLACSFCDTAYTWDEERYDLSRELSRRGVEELATWVVAHAPGRLIVTGGEPLLQQKQLTSLFDEVDARWSSDSRLVIEVETNGTVRPDKALTARVDQWNVSPKLENSGEIPERRVRPAALLAFSELPNAYFKFVVAALEDCEEVDALAARFRLAAGRVLLMPLASNQDELRGRAPQVAAWALARRARYSGRLHLELFDGRRGT